MSAIDDICEERAKQIGLWGDGERERARYAPGDLRKVAIGLLLIADGKPAQEVELPDWTAKIIAKHGSSTDALQRIAAAFVAAEMDAGRAGPMKAWEDYWTECPSCGQAAANAGGEYDCGTCGRATLHDPEA